MAFRKLIIRVKVKWGLMESWWRFGGEKRKFLGGEKEGFEQLTASLCKQTQRVRQQMD